MWDEKRVQDKFIADCRHALAMRMRRENRLHSQIRHYKRRLGRVLHWHHAGKIRQAFGLPHLYRSNGKQTLYYYNYSNGFFEVYFWYGTYAGNSVFEYGKTAQEQPYMEESYENAGKIKKDKYLMEIRCDIPRSEIQFIDHTTACDDVQNALGAPFGFEAFIQGEDGDRIETNEFLYDLEGSEVLAIIYSDSGYVMGAWIETAETGDKEMMVEISD